MEDSRKKIEDLVFEIYGTRKTSEIPLATFDDRDKIDFSRVRGSVRLMDERIITPKEADAYREKVLKMKLP
jgi:hypothetical protein